MPPEATPGLPPPRPIPIKDRSSILFIERGQLDVIDGAFVVVDARGVRTVIPVGGITCLMLEPGSRVSHAAVVLAARAGTLHCIRRDWHWMTMRACAWSAACMRVGSAKTRLHAAASTSCAASRASGCENCMVCSPSVMG
jgi:hypothetical protein